ncbi:MAG: glycosyltransferase [Bacteroidales bacterium]|nr:glycosyltransferase [Bacteroidales bacterium]MCB9014049.1 glycosyltransferase [Bacteroidales bacterium]
MIFEIIFWLSVAAIFHTYIVYPLVLKILAGRRKENDEVFRHGDDLPFISIIMSVHNEEAVISDKIRSIYYTLYPIDKFEVLVGSDNSSDGTNQICKVYTENYEHFHFFPFSERQGKPAVVNQLVEKARGEILILTDAKVFLDIKTLPELVKHFKNPSISIVGGNILNLKTNPAGISIQEKAFMNREIVMKYQEGLIWGKTMGIYGALYAIRKAAFTKVPDNFSVDDFFITMNVLRKKGRAILCLEATSSENVPDDMAVEFKRKVRISAGNFQNLRHFLTCLWPPYSSLSFAFLSHKVLRWMGPFFLILILSSSMVLASVSEFYKFLLVLQLFLYVLPGIDLILRKFNIHIIILRFITHFFAMNFALLVGFLKNLSGMKTNIWQPTRR